MRRHGLRAAVGTAAGLGMGAGAVLGLLEIHRSRDLEHGTWWLAWSRLSQPALLLGLAATAVALLLLLWPAFRRVASRTRPLGPLADLALLFGVLLAAAVVLHPTVGSLRAAGRPSVVLVSIDTLRADRFLGPRGAELMPRLRALAAEGTTFTQAMTTAPWTLPSHVSLFTSMLPFDHRVQWTRHHIGPRRSMLAERFRDAGYRTAAFTGASYVSAGFGFDQGFEVYEDHDEAKEGGSHAIFANALRWVRGRHGRPFFLFVHTYGPHFPYLHTEGVTVPGGRLGPGFTLENVQAAYRGELRLTPEERRYVQAVYDAGVRATDEEVGAFLGTLREEGILNESVLVLVSDHGEEFWEHVEQQSPGHGHSLYEELLHVPLMFRAPGRAAAGGLVASPVSLLDVAPTLLDLCGLPPDPDFRGRSLELALRTGQELPPRAFLAESIEYGPDRFALREGNLKAILTPFPERVHMNVHLDVRPVEVFDLERDPLEQDPESGRFHPRARAAFAVLVERSRYAARRGATAPRDGEITDELRDQLRSLGYLR